MSSVPYGYCHCGCGQKTSAAEQTRTSQGVRKGEPNRFIVGHNNRFGEGRRSPVDNGDGTFSIPLTKGHMATVDSADIPKVAGYNWYSLSKGGAVYAARDRWSSDGDGSKTIYMHRVVIDAPDKLHVDHVDGDGLNNVRSNIRTCSNQENSWNQGPGRSNSTGYIGVSIRKSGRFRAQIRVGGEGIRLGDFATAEEAARARDQASKEYFGDFARINFPERKVS